MFPPRGMSWETCDQATRNFVLDAFQESTACLGENLLSFIIHGSLAHGCYYRPKSDIDILAICTQIPTAATCTDLLRRLAHLNRKRPYTGSLEFSLILSETARHPTHPMSYIVHFSEAHEADILNKDYQYTGIPQNDRDLAAHLTVARAKGYCLAGSNPATIIGDIPWKNFLDSIIGGDLDWILENENILISPFYAVLNACRTCMTLRLGKGTIVSKEEGALWALSNLSPVLSPIIMMALDAYRSDTPVPPEHRRRAGLDWPRSELISFRDAMREELRSLL